MEDILMKKRFSLIILVCALLITNNANAKYTSKSPDTISFNAGAIIANDATIENTSDSTQSYNIESKGGSFQAEYNINFETFLIGVGLEYSFLRAKMIPDTGSESEYFTNHFLSPAFNIKFATESGLYFGAGGSAKYLLNAQIVDSIEFERKFDLWVQAMFGYHMPVSQDLFLDFGTKLGYNITNQQYKIIKGRTNNSNYEGKTAYEITLYIGIGYKIRTFNF
jgi:hypothetical protein